MNARRDKLKVARTATTPAEELVTKREELQHPVLKKLGDFFFDVAKLIFGGVILAGLMKQDVNYWILLVVGAMTIVITVFIGIVFILIANINRYYGTGIFLRNLGYHCPPFPSRVLNLYE